MSSRLVALFLVLMLGIVHAQLWIGRGSIPDVQAMSDAVGKQRSANETARKANERMGEEVRDLREGMEIVEEKARFELGMVRPNEVLVQFAR
jgi:cell division protein FtsB